MLWQCHWGTAHEGNARIPSSHSQHSYHDSQDRALAAIMQNLAELRLQTSHCSTTITTTSAEVNKHISNVHAEIYRLTSSFDPPVLRHALTEEIHKAVQQAISINTADFPSAQSRATGQRNMRNDTAPAAGRQHRKRRRLLDENETHTSTLFGTVLCSSRRYTIWNSALEGSHDEWTHCPTQAIEYQTAFRFLPSWWLTKCGFTSLVIAELSKPIQAGWKLCLNTKNVRTSSYRFHWLTPYSLYHRTLQF